MTIKSLFSVLTDEALLDGVIDHAEALSATFDAHYDALCLGVDRSQAGYYYAGASALVLQEALTRAQADAKTLSDMVEKRLEATTLRWGVESGVAQIADMTRHVAARACFSDLALLPKPYGENVRVEVESACEAVLFEAKTPAMILPPEAKPMAQPKQIMICWNESPQALLAARAALPFVDDADLVHVVVVDPPAHGPSRSDPGGMLSQYLARHGAKVEIEVLSKTMTRMSDTLLRHATDITADLVVMGAYGHSRFREAVFGGATRDMLERAEMPLLMAH